MQKVRRYDLDWLRVVVFGLLIIYHVGMFFVPWGWHIKNNVEYEWMTYPMLFVNQWRLNILFIISGMGTSFALAHRSGKTYIKERLTRLGIPLVMGMLLIIPPQVYIERLVNANYGESYLHFLFHDSFTRGIYPTGNISWHHLWFLPYLLIFSLVLCPLFIYLRNNPDNYIIRISSQILSKRFGIYLFTIPLYLAEAFLEPFFNVTHALIGDWFALTNYMILFFFGFLFINLSTLFWNAIDRIKHLALYIGIICFSLYLAINQFQDNTLIHFFEAAIKVINFWSWIIVLFGYSATWLNQKSKALNYCNTAVYPFYILHQTVTIVIAYFIMNWDTSLWIKFGILSAGTFGISWLLYEFLIRRIALLRPLFGLKKLNNSKHISPTAPDINIAV